jgi:hypothetical protein
MEEVNWAVSRRCLRCQIGKQQSSLSRAALELEGIVTNKAISKGAKESSFNVYPWAPFHL